MGRGEDLLTKLPLKLPKPFDGYVSEAIRTIESIPAQYIFAGIFALLVLAYTALYIVIRFSAPTPRPSTASEKRFRYLKDQEDDGSQPADLPCWQDDYDREQAAFKRKLAGSNSAEKAKLRTQEPSISEPEILISVVVPAYNEYTRIHSMLSRAIETLQTLWGDKATDANSSSSNGELRRRNPPSTANGHTKDDNLRGWEIIVVSDGSTDRTVDAVFSEARAFSLFGPSNLRVVELEKNRGKGGAVTHGMRHVRGKYVIFADADGATDFEDVKSMVEKARSLSGKDPEGKGRAIAIGSRAHYVEERSDVVVKRSLLRNMLMYAFHLFIRLLTTRRTSQIKDTQCGFKLFTRAALPDVIPHMHSEGWIFDVEMLMLAEMAGIPMEEVPVAWHEVEGSKLNVVWDSIGMAWGLLVIRLAWMMGIWQKT